MNMLVYLFSLLSTILGSTEHKQAERWYQTNMIFVAVVSLILAGTSCQHSNLARVCLSNRRPRRAAPRSLNPDPAPRPPYLLHR